SSQRVGAYLTMQNAFERQEALFLLEGKEFTERPSSHIQIDLPNPFTFLKRRMLACEKRLASGKPGQKHYEGGQNTNPTHLRRRRARVRAARTLPAPRR